MQNYEFIKIKIEYNKFKKKKLKLWIKKTEISEIKKEFKFK